MGASEEMETDHADVEIVDVEKDAKAWVLFSLNMTGGRKRVSKP